MWTCGHVGHVDMWDMWTWWFEPALVGSLAGGSVVGAVARWLAQINMSTCPTCPHVHGYIRIDGSTQEYQGIDGSTQKNTRVTLLIDGVAVATVLCVCHAEK